MDVVFLMDNQAMYGLCRSRLGVERPSYANINRYFYGGIRTSPVFISVENLHLVRIKSILFVYLLFNIPPPSGWCHMLPVRSRVPCDLAAR